MIEQYIRKSYQSTLVDPLVPKFNKFISPNGATGLAALLGFLVLPALIYQQPILAIGLLLLSGYCDTLDGTIARYRNQSTPLGTVLDIMSDRLVESAVILGLWWMVPPDTQFWIPVMLSCILLCVTSFLIVGLFTPNDSTKSFHYSPGLIERPEAFGFFIVMICLPEYTGFTAAVFSLLVLWTTIVRLYEFTKTQSRCTSPQ